MLARLNRSWARVSVVLVIVALIAATGGCGSTSPGESKNLQIRNWNDLNNIRNNLGGNHTLMNDLDSTSAGYGTLASPTANGGQGWQPIGTADRSFFGSFDGQGYEISDLYINRPSERDVGLFGTVYNETIIENLAVVNAEVTGQLYVGILAGESFGIVSFCYVSGDLIGGQYAGLLVGASAGTITSSYSAGSANGNTLVGGLVGGNTGTVSNSYSTVSAIGNSGVGGLVGGNSGDTSNCYSAGSVGGNDDVGGLVGVDIAGIVTSSLWDTQTSGQAASAGGTGLNTAEMQSLATFSGAGWDIGAVGSVDERDDAYVWNIVNDLSYPFLSWQA